MSIVCPECNQEFSIEESLDHSWVSAKRNFGCPHCRTFFSKHPHKGVAWGTSFGLPMLFVMIGFQGLVNSSKLTLRVVGGILLIAGIVLSLYNHRVIKRNIAAIEKQNPGSS